MSRFDNLFFALFLSVTACTHAPTAPTVADWYTVKELSPGLYRIDESDHVTFFVLKNGSNALFIDSGMGLSEKRSQSLLDHLGITTFTVLNTHSHCDHVGMNFMAKQIWIHPTEWKKYLKQSEIHQMEHYYKAFAELKWPPGVAPKQRPWKPTRWVTSAPVTVGDWKLLPIHLPGHTVGHVAYYLADRNILFTGDLIYDGELYLHLKDSSLKAFDQSLAALDRFIADHPGVALWPGHNTIPLPTSHVAQVRETVKKILSKDLKKGTSRHDGELFDDYTTFNDGAVKISVSDRLLP